MLPSAKKYLIKGGYSPSVAAYILIGCFMAGVVGIQVFSRLLHHYIPSHVVDCDHTHEEHEGKDSDEGLHDGHLDKTRDEDDTEDTPLLYRDDYDNKPKHNRRSRSATVETSLRPDAHSITDTRSRRPSLQNRLTTRVTTFVSGAKASCDEGGPCYGYSDPCGQECFKGISRSPTRPSARHSVAGPPRQPGLLRTATAPYSRTTQSPLQGLDEESGVESPHMPERWRSEDSVQKTIRGRQGNQYGDPSDSLDGTKSLRANGDSRSANRKRGISTSSTANPPNDSSQAHHHHVPTNAFLSIGLQTSIAIALHKLPEGFITYATNHANPKLGFAVFLALFIHNITEGFAMALPLYLALGSRWKAMFWSSLLGGVSQPLGAAIAALWFKLARRSDKAPDENVYGAMFAVTAGIMTSVALQLFSESLDLTHNRNICFAFAFIGIAILGVSFALTAD